jgi:osmotically-inducible protein OsmY
MLKPAIVVRTGGALLPLALLLCSAFSADNVNADRPANPALAAAANLQSACPTNQATDEAIVKAIQEKIKADAQFDDQRDHINVMSKNRMVKLEGWVNLKAQKNLIAKFSQTTDCVIKNKVQNKLKIGRQGSCAPGEKPCCGSCIDSRSTCNCMNNKAG